MRDTPHRLPSPFPARPNPKSGDQKMTVIYDLCDCPCLHTGVVDFREDCDDDYCGYCGMVL